MPGAAEPGAGPRRSALPGRTDAEVGAGGADDELARRHLNRIDLRWHGVFRGVEDRVDGPLDGAAGQRRRRLGADRDRVDAQQQLGAAGDDASAELGGQWRERRQAGDAELPANRDLVVVSQHVVPFEAQAGDGRAVRDG